MTKAHTAADAPSPALVALLQQALAHQKNKEMDEAEKLFKKALKDYPDNADVMQIAAIFFDQVENYPRALKLLEKVILKKPNDFNVNKLLGKALYQTGEYELAKLRLQKTLALNIEDAEANALFAQCLFRMGNGPAAAGFFKDSLKRKDSINIRNLLAQSLLFCGQEDEARVLLEECIAQKKFNYDTFILAALSYGTGTIEYYRKLVNAISLDPMRDDAKTLFTIPLTFEGIPDSINNIVADIVWLCLQSKNVNHDNLASLWARQFFQNPDNAKAHELLEAQEYKSFKALLDQEEYKQSLLKPLFIDGARKTRSYGVRLEGFYTNLRRYYLEKIEAAKPLDAVEIAVVAALTEQSFSNEFVFNETPQESAFIESCKESIATLPNPYTHILIYACYGPLTSLSNYKQLHRDLSKAPPWLQDTIKTHIGEVLEEQEIKKSIKKLGAIHDGVSKKVQEQYEENPYPRWRTANFIITPNQKIVDPKLYSKPKVLIAGCGTGQHVFHSYVNMPHAQITAMDLSTSSLAYAMRKVREYGIKGINFFQGDILQLDKLNQEFDIIECMGVLHHMKDPEAGLKKLLTLLKKGGTLALGLYSETARQDVVKARAIIAEQGFPPTVEGIRACREYIKQNSERFSFLVNSADFFSISAVRDLIFHVQETRYTLEQIKEMLDRNKLQFNEFKLPLKVIENYKKMFPEDTDLNNLDNWSRYEAENPSTFANMYQFSSTKL